MERQLTRRCRRSVRVAEFVTVDAFSATRTGGDAASSADRKTPLFAGYVEVLYARNAWLAVRVDIWMSRDVCHRQVKSSSVYLQQSENEVAVAMAYGSELTALQNVEKLDLSVADRGELPALTGDELTKVLEDVVKQFVDTFREQQVQALQAATSQRTKFEYEMLQHHPELEMLVLRSESIGNYVLFALPLLGEKPQWDPKKLVETEDLDSVFIPDGFHAPNFTVSTNGLTIFIGYPMEEETKSDGAWPLSVEWPARMLLSSQVTLTPPFSKGQSSVELVASCRKMFLQQWRRRKDFIAELRRHVIVLEYDAVDFSQVFFLLQEQLNDQAPLRILVLRLQFTAAYFLTNCTSDLQVNLLDGEAGAAPVTVALAASGTPPSPDPSADSQACVVQFLESTRKSLLRLFYGE
ncbi:hypothetical protein PC129_g3922 [Phytophthora cactorum]|uniref:Uncharacterized protein n=1 Tax=Phytophthora cactorum TaxID=29920 RepID=A0A329SE71_9STRA|nr:hypothetical protein Pcac1_g22714 [Phytophthora cactorum]KAG2837317.1 hypothetical protein PC111_g4696 [Phytophthora cactorum]KAG2844074.1 hypothetical protein PC112_g2365 [Phytophthora cactorum]KAG2862893.1 hypothetical protein PC113_g5908 [Phytophthora cactorum]KAG2930028.1 hypothetical protein PC114_g2588 [Phytophthora cactorum]